MFHICIPSFQRPQKLKNETLNTLTRFGVDREKINIFVIPEEEEIYKSVNPDYNIIGQSNSKIKKIDKNLNKMKCKKKYFANPQTV